MAATAGVPAPNAFIGQTTPPTDEDLRRALGPAKPVWDRLVASLTSEVGVNKQEWKSYSAKMGWSLRLLRGKRTIVWISPLAGSFQVFFILGDKAMQAARESDLPSAILKLLDEAPTYPEGTGVRLDVRRADEFPNVLRLAAIKLSN